MRLFLFSPAREAGGWRLRLAWVEVVVLDPGLELRGAFG